jgi:hypothetical protein
MTGLYRFGIIHGKGTGVLQRGIREHLERSTVVDSFHYAPPEEGGYGKTVVEIRINGNVRRAGVSVLGIAVVFLLTGCLDLTATLDMKDDGSGRFELEYRLDRDLFEMGVFDQESSFVPIPIHREDFEKAVARVDGVRLDRYRIERSESEVVVRSAVRFDSLDALNAYYNPGEERIRLNEANGTRTLVLDLHPDKAGDLDPETRAFAESYLSEHYLTVRLRAPSAIQSAENATVGDGGDWAQARFSLASLFTGDAPKSLSAIW